MADPKGWQTTLPEDLGEHTSEMAGEYPVGRVFQRASAAGNGRQAQEGGWTGPLCPVFRPDAFPPPADLHPLGMPSSAVALVPRATHVYRAGVFLCQMGVETGSGHRFWLWCCSRHLECFLLKEGLDELAGAGYSPHVQWEGTGSRRGCSCVAPFVLLCCCFSW